MLRFLFFLPLLISAAEPARTAKPVRRPIPLPRRIETILNTEEAKPARWGIHVVSLKQNKPIFERNAAERFTPASNTKLFSTSLAMEKLGPDHKFVTTLRGPRSPIDGVLRGDLRLVGGGDPTLSGRPYPYVKDAERLDPATPLEQLAAQLIARGVRVIDGDIIGDDRLYVYAPYPEGWTIDDSIWEYGAPVSALPFNDNAFSLSMKPGPEPGALARITLNPPSLPLIIDNRLLTVPNNGTGYTIDRAPGSRQVRITGTINQSSRGARELLAVDDPALYAAFVLHDVLTRHGIRVSGVPKALHRLSKDEPFDPSEGVELARRDSPALTEVARVVNKVSQNLHAEILLREVARVKANEPTREAGLKQLSAFLSELNIHPKAYHFEDGSGLSRRTLIAPSTITTLLTYMNSRPYAEAWDSLLPIAGLDGTLSSRFDKQTTANAIHAKTGTLATVNALSGYVTTKRGARLAFSIIANNHTGGSANIRKTIDRIGLALLEYEGQ